MLQLDFEGAASVKVTGSGRYKLTPQVRVLTQEPTAEVPEEGGSPETEKVPQTVPSGPEPGELQGVKGTKVEMEGPIESIGDDWLVIRGQTVIVTDETEEVGTLVQGAVVTVEALRQDDGSLIAVEVIVAGRETKSPKCRSALNVEVVRVEAENLRVALVVRRCGAYQCYSGQGRYLR